MTNPANNLIAPVERLSARLGVTLTANTPDYVRAEEALWSASARAREIADRTAKDDDWADPSKVPDSVVDIVLSAALRIFKNPDRFISNQAGSYMAQLAQSDFTTGSIFLAGEVSTLEKYRPNLGVQVVDSYRDDPSDYDIRADPNEYVADPINQGLGDPFYGFAPNGPHWPYS